MWVLLATTYPGQGWEGWPAVAAVVGGLAAVALVEHLGVSGRRRAAFWPLLPCGVSLPALVGPPAPEGEAAGIRWWTDPDGSLGWVADRGVLPRGMRGRVWLAAAPGGRVDLSVSWTPWWLPLAAAVALAVLGGIRGDGPVAGALAAMVAAMGLLGGGSQAGRAALVVRQALVVGSERGPEP